MIARIPKAHGAHAARYFVVIVVGLIVDIALSYTLSRVTALPLAACSAAGFLTAVLVNYALFESWVFDTRCFSWRRLALSYASSSGALAVRIVAISLLAMIPSSSELASLFQLIAAAGLSFAVNFLFINIVFGSGLPGQPH